MNTLAINNMTLVLAASLVVISLFLSYKEQLKLEKSMIVSVVRAVVQLTVIGYVLKYVFQSSQLVLVIAMFLVICFNASYNAAKKNPGIPNIFRTSLIAITSGTLVTLAILVASGSIQLVASQVVPITGMIASNSMVAIGLCYRHMTTAFKDRRQQVQERLALGANLKQASRIIVRESIRTGITPTLDSTKTMGIVSLPGMMSGLIFAGVDPVHAIKYQIMVVFMLMSTTAIASVIACYGSYRGYFNEYDQLV